VHIDFFIILKELYLTVKDEGCDRLTAG